MHRVRLSCCGPGQKRLYTATAQRSVRVSVYAGTDPLTGRQIRLRRTCKTERTVQIELGKLLEQADAGRQPETDATVAQLMDSYAAIADG
jgi:integrase